MKKYALIITLLAMGAVAQADDTTPRTYDTNNVNRTERYDKNKTAQDLDKSQIKASQEYSSQTYQPGTQPQRINKASSLIGMTVRNSAGEKLGSIKDMVVDFDSGKVSYVVFAADNGLLKPDSLHAVPLDAFQRGADGNMVTLNADKTKLSQAPGLERDSWPNVQNPAWGAQPFWEKRNDINRYHPEKYSTEDKSRLNQPTPDRNNTDTDSTAPRIDTQPK
jgi:sporulation protein YlmC with PRC-barrel domain